MTKHDLEKMTVLKLREEAMKFPDLKSTHSMNKEELIATLMEHLGIHEDAPTTVSRKRKKVKKSKQELKKAISELKTQREEALQAKDAKLLKNVRYKIKKIKRNLRRLAA
ncbi:MAG: transcription termination factor Rho [bacterium]